MLEGHARFIPGLYFSNAKSDSFLDFKAFRNSVCGYGEVVSGNSIRAPASLDQLMSYCYVPARLVLLITACSLNINIYTSCMWLCPIMR